MLVWGVGCVVSCCLLFSALARARAAPALAVVRVVAVVPVERRAREPVRGERAVHRAVELEAARAPAAADEEEEEDRDELSMIDVRNRILAAGFTESQLMDCIQEVRHRVLLINIHVGKLMQLLQYENIDVWTRVANNTKLRFVNA